MPIFVSGQAQPKHHPVKYDCCDHCNAEMSRIGSLYDKADTPESVFHIFDTAPKDFQIEMRNVQARRMKDPVCGKCGKFMTAKSAQSCQRCEDGVTHELRDQLRRLGSDMIVSSKADYQVAHETISKIQSERFAQMINAKIEAIPRH